MSILQFPSGRPSETQPFQFLANLSLQPSSVVTLVLTPTYYALWDLLLSNSNSRLFSPGHTLSPRFLSLGNTRRVPDTRPSETTSRSNSPVYPRRGHTPSRRGLFNTNTHTHPMTYLLLLPPYDLLHLPPYNNVAPSTLKQCCANCYSTL